MKGEQDSRPLSLAGAWPVQCDPRLMSLLRSCLQHMEGRDRVMLYHVLQARDYEPPIRERGRTSLAVRMTRGDVDGFSG